MDDPIEVEFPSTTPGAVSTNASVKWYAFDAPAGYQIDWAVTHTVGDDVLKVSIHAEVDPTATPTPERVEYLSFEVGALDAEDGSFYSKLLARWYIGVEPGAAGLTGSNSFSIALSIGTPAATKLARVVLISEPVSPAAGGYSEVTFRLDILAYDESDLDYVWVPFDGEEVWVRYAKSEVTDNGFAYGVETIPVSLVDGAGTFDWPFTVSGSQGFQVIASEGEFDDVGSPLVTIASGSPFAVFIDRDKAGPLPVMERDPEDPRYQFGEEGASLGREAIWITLVDEFGNQVGTDGETDALEVELDLDLSDLADTDIELEVVILDQEDSGATAPGDAFEEVDPESEASARSPKRLDPTSALLTALCQASPPPTTTVALFAGATSGQYQSTFGLVATNFNPPQSRNVPYAFSVTYSDGVSLISLDVFLYSGTTGANAASAGANAVVGQAGAGGGSYTEQEKLDNLWGPYCEVRNPNIGHGPTSHWLVSVFPGAAGTFPSRRAWASLGAWHTMNEPTLLSRLRANPERKGNRGYRDMDLTANTSGVPSNLGLGLTGTMWGNRHDEFSDRFAKDNLPNEDCLVRSRGWEIHSYWWQADFSIPYPTVMPTVRFTGELHAAHDAKATLSEALVGRLEYHNAAATFSMKCWGDSNVSFFSSSTSATCGVAHDSSVRVGGVSLGASLSGSGPGLSAGVTLMFTETSNKYSDTKAKPDHKFDFVGNGPIISVGSTLGHETHTRCYDDWPGSIPLAQGKVHWNMWRLDSSWTEVVKLLPGGGTSVAAFKRELK